MNSDRCTPPDVLRHSTFRCTALGKACALALLLSVLFFAQILNSAEGIRRDEMANLQANGLVAVPEKPLLGEPVRLSLVVANQSQNPARNVEIALFVDGSRVASATVDIAGGRRLTVPLLWKPASTGLAHLIAYVDPERRLVEEDRDDNISSLDVAVIPTNARPSTLSVTDLKLVNESGSTTVRARVQNNGTESAAEPLVFRVQDAIVATRQITSLAPGSSALVEATVPTPLATENISVETGTSSLVSSRTSLPRQTGPQIDLRIEALSVHSAQFEETRSRRVTISFRIVNAGANPISVPFRTRISPASVKASQLTDEVLITDRLSAGEKIYVSRLLESPPGEFDVRVETDVDRATGDVDYSNNLLTAHFKNPTANVDRWVSIGPRRIDQDGLGAVGALFHLAINPKVPSTIFVGGNGEGIWKTLDAGQNWQPVTDSLPTLRSTALALDASNPARLYLVTPDEGVFKTFDAGNSWTQLDPVKFQPVVAGLAVLRVHPTNPNLLFLTSEKGLYTYHADAPQSKWALPLDLAPATDVIVDPGSRDTIYATLRDPATGLYTSFDSGAHWSRSLGCPGGSLPAVDGVQIITLAFAGDVMYAAFKSDGKLEVYRTTGTSCVVGSQREQSWERRFTITGRTANELWNRIDGDPATPNVVYISGIKLFVSNDGAKSFSVQSGPQPHDDYHGFAADPTAPQNIYVICDGGIYRSSKLGAPNSWQFIGDDIFNVQFYASSLAETDPILMIGGTQDNGTLAYNGSTIWNRINDGDGATTAIDPTNAQIQYSMHQGPDSMLKQQGTSGWKHIACGIPVSTSCFNLFFELDPTSPTTVLASCNSLLKADAPVCKRDPDWRVNDTGDPNAYTSILPQSAVKGLVVRSAVDRQVKLYYAGTNTGQLWAGPAGTSWQLVFSAAGPISDIEIDRDDPSTLYVTTGSGSIGRVYRMQRLAPAPTSSTFKAVDITANLQLSLVVKTIAVDRMNAFTIYAGTNSGMYRGKSLDQGVTWNWAPYMNGFPRTDVRDLAVNAMTGVLRATTFGRGAYEVNTGDPVGSLLTASGKVSFLRTNDPGGGFGPPSDLLDAEVIVQLDRHFGKSFGFQLRPDDEEDARSGMLRALRSAFRNNLTISIDYLRTGIHNGRIIRVAATK